MARSLALVLVHIIFSTKNRSPFLQSTEVRSQAHAYLTGTLRALDCAPLELGGVADHVHIYSLRSLQKDLSRRIGQESQNQLEQDPKRQRPRRFQFMTIKLTLDGQAVETKAGVRHLPGKRSSPSSLSISKTSVESSMLLPRGAAIRD